MKLRSIESQKSKHRRVKLYARVVLGILYAADSFAMETGSLWNDVRLTCHDCAWGEFNAALTILERKGQIAVIKVKGQIKAKITEAGRARSATPILPKP